MSEFRILEGTVKLLERQVRDLRKKLSTITSGRYIKGSQVYGNPTNNTVDHQHTGAAGSGGGTLKPTTFQVDHIDELTATHGVVIDKKLALAKSLNLTAGAEQTIAAGVITAPDAAAFPVDTQGDAATDDLDTINGLVAGRLYIIYPADGARTVVVKHGTGNIHCIGNADYTLDDDHDWLWVYSPDGTNACHHVHARSSGRLGRGR